ncbi:hypothetical protein XENOCAPTIV_004331 [Xenoophorus captivus]|uniref:F-box domain-containing protein n=1 Tax=Xenoophorus captivus TaxID=1517983 RepID=A0ABV0S5X9_9TELE
MSLSRSLVLFVRSNERIDKPHCLSLQWKRLPLLSHPALRERSVSPECSDRLLQMPPFGAAPLGGPNHIPCRTGIVVRSNTNCRSVSIYACSVFSQLAMALCGGVGAMALPSELIVHIFSFLSDRDKLRASAVCSRWRECLFYPALWTELKLRIGGGDTGGCNGSSSDETPKLEFLMRKFGSFVRELQLELAPVEGNLSPLSNDPSAGRMEQLPGGQEGDPQQLSERWRDAMATYLDQVLCVFTTIRNNR